MASSGMLRRVTLVRTDVSEELSAPVIKVTRVTANVPSSPILIRNVAHPSSGQVVTASVVPSSPILVTLVKEALSSCEVFLRSVRRLLVTASVVPSSQILVTLMNEELRSSERSVLTRTTRRNKPDDGILHRKEIVG
jgi:hypothetical protein